MKKKLLSTGLIAVLCLASVLAMTACGEKVPYSDYDLSEYVEVGEYKGLEYDKISVSVSDKEVEEEIQSRLEAHATTETVESGTVKDGDTVSIAYEGRMDGKTFEGGTGENESLVIGSGSFIDGFESGLVGKEVGSTVELDLTFPEDYGKDSDGNVTDESKAELAGKPVTFEVNIKSRQETKTPEYNMDFVKEYYSDYDSLEAFEAGVKEELLEKKTSDAETEIKTALWQQIVEASEVKKYPEEKDALIESETKAMEQAASDNGMEMDEYLESIGYTEEDMESLIKQYSESIVFEEMVLYSIAAKEEIEITDKEYEEHLEELLKEADMDADTFESSYNMTIEEWGDENNVRSSMLLNKVMDKVMEYGKEVSE